MNIFTDEFKTAVVTHLKTAAPGKCLSAASVADALNLDKATGRTLLAALQASKEDPMINSKLGKHGGMFYGPAVVSRRETIIAEATAEAEPEVVSDEPSGESVEVSNG